MDEVAAQVTFLIPTFERAQALTQVIDSIGRFAPRSPVLIVDDGSRDATAEAVAPYLAASHPVRLTMVRHDRNRGYAHALLTGIGSVTTEWIALWNDDVLLVETPDWGSLHRADRDGANLVTRRAPKRPARFGAWRSRRGGHRIDPAEFQRATAHGPGLLFRRTAVESGAGLLRHRLERSCEFAGTYPQTLIGLECFARGRAVWMAERILDLDQTTLNHPTGLLDDEGHHYKDATRRLHQFIALAEILQGLASTAVDPQLAWSYGRMRRANEEKAASWLRFVLANPTFDDADRDRRRSPRSLRASA